MLRVYIDHILLDCRLWLYVNGDDFFFAVFIDSVFLEYEVFCGNSASVCRYSSGRLYNQRSRSTIAEEKIKALQVHRNDLALCLLFPVHELPLPHSPLSCGILISVIKNITSRTIIIIVFHYILLRNYYFFCLYTN